MVKNKILKYFIAIRENSVIRKTYREVLLILILFIALKSGLSSTHFTERCRLLFSKERILKESQLKDKWYYDDGQGRHVIIEIEDEYYGVKSHHIFLHESYEVGQSLEVIFFKDSPNFFPYTFTEFFLEPLFIIVIISMFIVVIVSKIIANT